MASGHIRRARRDGKVIKDCWDVQAELGAYVDAQGERQRPRKTARVHGLREDAERVLTQLKHELDTGVVIDPKKLTVADLLDRWLDDYARQDGKLSPTTLRGYEDIVRIHLKPRLGKVSLAKLQPMQIQAYYTHALKAGKQSRVKEKPAVPARPAKGRRKAKPAKPAVKKPAPTGLSPATVMQHHTVLHEALQYAVGLRLRKDNPASATEPPSVPLQRRQRRRPRALPPTGLAHVIAASEGTDMYLPVVLAATTGMRRSELCGLRWRDVDLKAKRVFVDEPLVHDGTRALVHKEPKSAAGRRAIPIGALTVRALKEQRADQGRRRKALRGKYRDEGYVIDEYAGGPVRPDTLSSRWRALAIRAGVEGYRLHDLRHSYATEMMEHEHPKLVSERLGHSTVAFTMQTYQHVGEDAHRAAADAFDARLADADPADWADNGQTNAPVQRLRRGRSSGKSPAK
jgi:integrase